MEKKGPRVRGSKDSRVRVEKKGFIGFIGFIELLGFKGPRGQGFE